ncbi:MAG: phosphatidate cytidylyltransferase [Bacteroidaceae bacterium]|nr:phosphatidate cytidylyltransferase [Bacteroidaceae bacterium]
MNNLIVRALTGAVFVAVMVGGMLYGPLTFGLLFLVITALTTWEFTGIMSARDDVSLNRMITTVASCCLFLGSWGYANGLAQTPAAFAPWLLSLIYLFVEELYLQEDSPLNNWAYTMMAQLYIALPFSLLCFLESSYQSAGMLSLSIFIFLWCNDTGAYLSGSLLGRHKLFPRVSPGKSWEGSIGGGLLCVGVSQLVAHYVTVLPPLVWAGFALVVVVFGTWGDLVESLLKRSLGIKDSGNILPGHGGMLDRFDSSLLAIPAVMIYLLSLSVM